MTTSSDRNNQGKFWGLADSLRRRKEGWLVVNKVQVGDIRTERTVLISREAAVAGTIFSPRVIIEGFLHGNIVSREILVQQDGQIWGDIFAVAAELAPRCKIRGWLHTLDEGTVGMLQAGELSVTEISDTEEPELPQSLLDTFNESGIMDLRDNHEEIIEWLAAMRQMRFEAATALFARIELEALFERRLDEALRSEEIRKNIKGLNDYEAEMEETHEREIALLRESAKLAAKEALEYRNRYLWAKASILALQSQLNGGDAPAQPLADEDVIDLGDSGTGTNQLINASDSDAQIAELGAKISVQDLEIKYAKEKINEQAKQLTTIKRLANRRIKRLEQLLAKADQNTPHDRERSDLE